MVQIRIAKTGGGIEEALKFVLTGVNIPVDKKVIIKPNLSQVPQRKGITTNPEVMDALISFLLRKGIVNTRIIVCESSIVGRDTKEALRGAGIDKVLAKHGVAFLDLKTIEMQRMTKISDILLPDILQKRDEYYIINVPVMKTHAQTLVTLGLKNLKGFLPDTEKKNFHRTGLEKNIARLAKIVGPNLTIIDATYCTEGFGPSTLGKLKKVGLILAGEDPLATDIAACTVMGFDWEKVEHLRHAGEMGVGSTDAELVGEWECPKFELPDLQGLYRYKKTIVYFSESCSGCFQALSDATRMLKGGRGLFKGLKVMLRPLTIIVGRHEKKPTTQGKVILCGNCTKNLDDGTCIFIPGCPPKPKEIVDKI